MSSISSTIRKIKFHLVKLPLISITLFFVFYFIAAFLHPGSEKEIINYKSDKYSFTHNFLSELGTIKTNTDEENPNIIQKSNTPSMILFNGSLIIIGCTLILFYNHFKKIFKIIKDHPKAMFYANITRPFGLIAGILFSGIGLVPHDLHFETHVFFANGAFLILFVLSIFHSITVFFSKHINNFYSLGYLLFCVLLFSYLLIIFFGPQIGPGKIFNEQELMLQVIAQKSIVLTFTISILIQVMGFYKLLQSEEIQKVVKF